MATQVRNRCTTSPLLKPATVWHDTGRIIKVHRCEHNTISNFTLSQSLYMLASTTIPGDGDVE